ncbi:hypothetical protein [Bacillus suaedaesalsae]|uniref:YtkA-like domain-containing protein n=1 Tax=Bacillus suaedaesalsae TaxID=2810349 RepID=A0ABS2DEI3_9BACI|nr:hypothetical protein [Bacillus suaedaesalsae]MBM6616882.1 hypothetical protein [Bacillus suaedaesalsae]
MKKLVFVFMIAIIMIISACGNENHEHFKTVEEATSNEQGQKPTLKANVEIKNGKAILYVETDMKISKDNYGKARKEGEGHVHVYVNNGEKQGVSGFPYELEGVEKGENIISISLHNNDHTPYGVSEEIKFELK